MHGRILFFATLVMHFHIQCIPVCRMVYNYLYNIHSIHLLNDI